MQSYSFFSDIDSNLFCEERMRLTADVKKYQKF